MDILRPEFIRTIDDTRQWTVDLHRWLSMLRLEELPFVIYVDPSETDQGIAGRASTLYDVLTALGTTNKATVRFRHTRASATTTYTVATTFDASTYTNVKFEFENGAILSVATAKTLTLPSPASIIASPNQQIFSGAGAIAFGTGNSVYPNWWTFNTTPGTTDMTSAIQAAITAVENKGGKVILLGETYAISSDLNITHPITIEGSGWDSIILQSADTMAIHAEDLTAEQVGLTLREFAIDMDGNGQLSAGAIQVNNFAGFLIDHVYIIDANRIVGTDGVDGIAVSQAAGTSGCKGTIQNCLVDNCSKVGIYASGGSGATSDSVVNIRDNIVRNSSGIAGAVSCGITAGGSWHCLIDGNAVYDCDAYGIFVGSGSSGASDYPLGITITNNRVWSCGAGTATNADGISVLNSLGTSYDDVHSLISNNWVYNCGTTNSIAASGILIQNINQATVSNNRCHLNETNGIALDNCDNVVVSDNICTGNNQSAGASPSGLYIRHVNYGTITGNVLTDYQVAPTQAYGIIFDTSASGISNLVISNNYLVGNLTGTIQYNTIPTTSIYANNFLIANNIVNGFVDRNFTQYNTSGAGEDDLASTVFPQNIHLHYKGIRILAAGAKTNGNTENKTIKLYIGTAAYTVHAAAANTNDWRIEAEVLFPSSTAQWVSWKGYDGVTLLQGFENAAQNTSTGTLTIKVTGECATGTDIVTQYMWMVELF